MEMEQNQSNLRYTIKHYIILFYSVSYSLTNQSIVNGNEAEPV